MVGAQLDPSAAKFDLVVGATLKNQPLSVPAHQVATAVRPLPPDGPEFYTVNVRLEHLARFPNLCVGYNVFPVLGQVQWAFLHFRK